MLCVRIILNVFAIILIAVWPAATLRTVGQANFISALLSILHLVITALWIYRAYRNLTALGMTGLRWTPGWAAGYFFIPFLNLVRPYQIVKDIWNGSVESRELREGGSWKQAKGPRLVKAWWAWYLVAIAVTWGNIILSNLYGQTVGRDIIVYAVDVLPFILNILVVSGVTQRQEEAAKSLLQPSATVSS